MRERLIEAGVEVLLEEGFLGASARAIAQRAGTATGSIHYYFDSTEDLLLAALDRTVGERREEYRRITAEASDPQALMGAISEAVAKDRASGRVRLLAQLMATATTGGPLAAAVADQTAQWSDLTAATIERIAGPRPLGIIDARDAATALTALFIGLELLDHVDPDRFDSVRLLEVFGPLAQLLSNLIPADTP
jgi:AcrR family transcriptional regulator